MEGQAGVPAYPVRGLLMSNGSDGNLFSVCKLLHVAEPPSTSYQRSGGIVPGNFGWICIKILTQPDYDLRDCLLVTGPL